MEAELEGLQSQVAARKEASQLRKNASRPELGELAKKERLEATATSSEANVTTGSDSRKRPFTLSAKNRMVVYERVWLGLPVKGGGVTGGPVKQVMSVKEGKAMFFFSVSVFSGSLA